MMQQLQGPKLDFQGWFKRPEEEQLLRHLQSPSGALLIQGLPNTGKKALVARTLKAFTGPYQFAAWIYLSNTADVYAQLLTLAGFLKLEMPSPLSLDELMDRIAKAFQKRKEGLLVVEGMEASYLRELTFLYPLLREHPTRCIFISRSVESLQPALEQEFQCMMQTITVTTLSERDVVNYLTEQLKEPLDNVLRKSIWRATGGYIGQLKVLCKTYQHSLDNDLSAFWSRYGSTVKSPNFLIRLLKEKWEKLRLASNQDPIKQKDIENRKILWLTGAFFSTAPIPWTLFATDTNDFQATLERPLQEQTLLLSFDRVEKTYQWQSFIQEALRSVLTEEEQQKGLKLVISALRKHFHYLSSMAYTVSSAEAKKQSLLLTHVQSVLESVSGGTKTIQSVLPIQSIAELWASVSNFYYRYYRDFPLALNWIEKGIAFMRTHLPLTVRESAYKQNTDISLIQQHHALLFLYASEFYHLQGKLLSQLTSVKENDSISKSHLVRSETLLRRAFKILKRVSEVVPTDTVYWYAMAYTLRDYTRLLRKVHKEDEASPYLALLKSLVEDSRLQDPVARLQLRIDFAIIQKGWMDQQPTKDYQAVIRTFNTLEQHYETYKHEGHSINPVDQATIWLYQAETEWAVGAVNQSVFHYLKLLHLSTQNHPPAKHIGRAGYELAEVLRTKTPHVAKLILEKTLSEQVRAYLTPYYKDKTKRLIDKLQESLGSLSNKPNSTGVMDAIHIMALPGNVLQFSLTELEMHLYRSLMNHVAIMDQTTINSVYPFIEAMDVLLSQKLALLSKDKQLTLIQDSLEKLSLSLIPFEQQVQQEAKLAIKQTELWYRQMGISQLHLTTKRYISELTNALTDCVIGYLRKANGVDTRKSGADVAFNVGEAVARAIPSLNLSVSGDTTTASIKPTASTTVDISRMTEKLVQTGREVHEQNQRTQNQFAVEGFKPDRYRQAAEEMALMVDYLGRCYAPQLEKLEEVDVSVLVKQSVARISAYYRAGYLDPTLPIQERLLVAVTGGNSNNKRLQTQSSTKTSHWYSCGFFTKPGLQSQDATQQVTYHIKDPEHDRPDKYGYRLSSPLSVKNLKSYASPEEAEDAIVAAKEIAHRCTIS